MMAAGSPISNRNAARNRSATQPGPVFMQAAQPNSTADSTSGIVSDFNALLVKLRAAGVISS